MKKLVIALSLAASIAAIPPAVLADQGEVGRQQIHREWVSSKVCFPTYCTWRAGTSATNVGGEFLAVDFYDDGKTVSIALIVNNIPIKTIRSWESDFDSVPVKFRADRNPIIETYCDRYLDRKERTLYWRFEVKDGMLDAMRFGNTLRIQSNVNGSKFTHVFSLSGAMAAIDRAHHNSEASSPPIPRPRRRTDDDYFDDSAPVQNPGDRI